MDVSPKGAVVKRDGKVVTTRQITLSPGEKASLEISAKGYETRAVVIDGSESPVAIALDPEKHSQGTGKAPDSRGKATHKLSDGTIETW